MRKRPGTSLLLVMMIITGVVTVIFATQRVAMIQFSQSTSEEDNLFAMYAAKAGIEDGLMRFRYNRNAEIRKYQRVYYMQGKFTAEGVEVGQGQSDADYRPDDQYYDLGITYRTNSIEQTIGKDETIELTGFERDTNLTYSLKFKDCDNGDPRLQFVRLREGFSIDADQKSFDIDDVSILFFAGDSLRVTLVTPKSDCRVNLAGTSNTRFDGLTTYITSTGYYGAAKRTFVAEVNRLTGSLISIYEFTTYSGGKIEQPL